MTATSDTPPTGQRRLRPGERVGQYQLVRQIGEGGMGWVYLARDTQLGRKVALKVIRPDQLQASGARERLLREAEATAQFSHPNIVTIYGLGEIEGAPYLALEYLEGRTLRERASEGALAPAEVLRIGHAVALALTEAHRRGIVHRDIKPENIFLQRDGRVRVLDFGLARPLPGQLAPDQSQPLRSFGAEDAPWTSIGGTRGYIAPELWDRALPGPAVDIWSLGVLLYELLTGQRPGEDRPPPSLASLKVEPRIEAVLAMCLSRDPATRPSAEAVAVALSQAPRAEGRRVTLDVSPYRGLLPFHREHAEIFFGRDREVRELAQRLNDQPLLAIVGPPGAGKSSLVQAGLIPALTLEGYCDCLVVRPGPRPLRALAQQLTRSASISLLTSPPSSDPGSPVDMVALETEEALHQRIHERPALLGMILREKADAHQARVLLVIDQLEEIFTQTEEVDSRSRFFEALLGAADDRSGPVRVVLTVRDDFLGRLAGHPELASEVERGVFLLRTPGTDELAQILTRPLEQHGYRFEDDELVQEMVREVEGQPAALPLLQFAAQRMWEERDKEARRLLRAVHARIGGVAGALADHAEHVMDSLSGSSARAARALLLRLVTADGTRAVVERQTLLDEVGDGAAEALRQLVDARLVVTRAHGPGEEREGAVELAHESLVMRWARLRRWREESREDLETLQYLSAAARQWARGGSRDADLLRGESLAEALRWQARLSPGAAGDVRRYIEASTGQSRRDERRRRRLRLGATLVLVFVALLSVTAALWIARQERRAKGSAREAELALGRALLEGARSDWLQEDLVAARAKLRSALAIEDSVAGRALWQTLRTQPLRFKASVGGMLYAAALSHDGRLLATGGADGVIRLHDLASGELRLLRGHEAVFDLKFAPDDRRLASGGVEGTVRLWEVTSGAGRLVGRQRGRVVRVAFAADGRKLAAGGEDSVVRVWTLAPVASGSPRALRGHRGEVLGVAFLPDGTLLSSGEDHTVRRWDVAAARSRIIASVDDRVTALAADPRGRMVAFARSSGVIELRSLVGGTTRTLAGHSQLVRDLAFDSSGERLASAGWDTMRLWSVRADGPGESVAVRGHTDRVYSVSFGAGGALLASASVDTTARVWSTAALRAPGHGGHTDRVHGMVFDPRGRWLASASVDTMIRLWDPRAARSRLLRGHEGGVIDVDTDSAGRLLASSSLDRTVRVWDLATGAVRVLRGHTANVDGVAIARDGRRAAGGGWDQTVRVWDVQSGAETVLRGHTARVHGVAFDPAGRRLASGSLDDTVRIWDLATSRTTRVLRGPAAGVFGVGFDPAGRFVAGACGDGVARLWDLASSAERPALELRGHVGNVWDVAFHPAGTLLATGGQDGTARLWSLPAGGPAGRICCHRGDVNGVAFSADGETLATGGDDGTVRLWSHDGKPRWRPPLSVGRCCAPARVSGALASRRIAIGSYTVVGYTDGVLERLDPAPFSAPLRFAGTPPHAVTCLAAGPMQTVVAGHSDGTLILWDLSAGKPLLRDRLHGPVAQLQIGREASELRAGSELGDELRWDLQLLQAPYCTVLRSVWDDVTVEWSSGRAVTRPRPSAAQHRCGQ